MTTIGEAVGLVLPDQITSKKPLAIMLAGHNGSGKSTMWEEALADTIQIPLINADRMMMSILPERNTEGHLPTWASELRDNNTGWMGVAQKGVRAFVSQALGAKVPFAMETVFSYWEPQPDGVIFSKIDDIREYQREGYFVLLLFVGLSDSGLSVLRVHSRVQKGGHGIPANTLERRFPKTQNAISEAIKVVDASILTDNSRDPKAAFTVCRVQSGAKVLEDIRDAPGGAPAIISNWLDVIAPRQALG